MFEHRSSPLLWRVRNRLLLTYFLFAVVPIGLIGLMLSFVGTSLLGFGRLLPAP